jgi:chemotaxis protein methyltransferase CheR
VAFSFFFRDREVLNMVLEHALPELRTRMYINIWDAGCAMGQEAYTLAMLMREQMTHFMFRNLRIYATDIDENGTFGTTITSGLYEYDDVARIPAEFLARYFTPVAGNGHMQIDEELRRAVRFERHDLLSLKAPRTGLGLILCKNVLLHFQPHERVEVMRMFHGALMDGGYFVTEHTQKLPEELSPLFRKVTEAGPLYQKISLSQPV